MAVTLIMRVPELTPERYDRMVAELDLDDSPPPGLILHLASEGVGAINMLQLWQTPQTAEMFVATRLDAALRRQGVKQQLSYRLEPLHNLFVSDPEVVARIGASSLPAGVRARPQAS